MSRCWPNRDVKMFSPLLQDDARTRPCIFAVTGVHSDVKTFGPVDNWQLLSALVCLGDATVCFDVPGDKKKCSFIQVKVQKRQMDDERRKYKKVWLNDQVTLDFSASQGQMVKRVRIA